MWKKILLGLAAVVVVFFSVVAFQPNEFKISRSTVIHAAPSAVYPHVNDFHQWEAWSPWDTLDPQMKRAYSGVPTGAGAEYSWAGNGQVGEGKMTITESRNDSYIAIRLEFLKPFQATNKTEFEFVPLGAKTLLTWTMTGTRSFLEKAFCLFVNMDKMVGGDFEKGLAQLKDKVENKG